MSKVSDDSPGQTVDSPNFEQQPVVPVMLLSQAGNRKNNAFIVLLYLHRSPIPQTVINLSSTPSLPFSLRPQRRATDECYFLERLESNNYNTYRSKKYPEMYVALQRSGQYKTGTKTGPGQKAILFLPMASRS